MDIYQIYNYDDVSLEIFDISNEGMKEEIETWSFGSKTVHVASSFWNRNDDEGSQCEVVWLVFGGELP